MKERIFNDFAREMLKASLQEAFAIRPIVQPLVGMLLTWASYAMLTSGIFIPVSDFPAWLTSSSALGLLSIVSCLSLLLMSAKSLVPATAIWVSGIVLCFAQPSIAMWAFMSAVVSAAVFRMFPLR